MTIKPRKFIVATLRRDDLLHVKGGFILRTEETLN